MDHLCRACRKTGEDYRLNSMMISGLLDIYSFCTNIPISEDNEKCYKICEHCTDLLIRFNDFKKLCIESDDYFKRTTFLEIKIEVPKDPLQPFKEHTFEDLLDDHSEKDVKNDFYDSDHFDDNNYENVDNNPTPFKSLHQSEICSKKFLQVTRLKKHNRKCKNKSKKAIKGSERYLLEDVKDQVNDKNVITIHQFLTETSDLSDVKNCEINGQNSKYKRKQQVKHGLQHETKNGIVRGKMCKRRECCKMLCLNKISAKRQKEIFNQFYELDWTSKEAFITEHIKVVAVSRKTKAKNLQSRRQNTRTYRLQDENGVDHEVCKTYFKDTLDICDGKISNALSRKQNSGTPENDKRGKHTPHNKRREEDENFVCDFISRFPKYDSYYCQAGTSQLSQKKIRSETQHQCKLCLKKFVYPASLKRHHPRCKKLKSEDKKSHDLKVSKNKIWDIKSFFCPVCSLGFVTKHAFKAHVSKHTGEKPLQCTYCDNKYKQARNLRAHVEKAHLQTTKYPCPHCSKSYYTKRDLTSHITYTHSRTYECDLCHKIFRAKLVMAKHIQTHFNMKCNICKEEFTNKVNYRNHMLIHLENNPYKCKICETDFIHLKTFKHHVKTDHPGKRNEDCLHEPLLLSTNIKDAITNFVAPLKRLKLIPESDKNFVCNICAKRFVALSGLNAHLLAHTGEKPFSCDKCDRKFNAKGQLNLHRKRIHDRIVRFKCGVCSFQSYTSHQMTRHTISHYNEKPYPCDLCDAGFKCAKSLQIHKRSHTGEKPYSCTYCSKEFASSSYLRQHQYIHTGEKPFACKICDKRFNQRTPLTRHMDLHKNEGKAIRTKINTKHTEVKDVNNTFSF